MSDGGTVCGNCGTVNEWGAQFCMNCGVLLAAYVSALDSQPAQSHPQPVPESEPNQPAIAPPPDESAPEPGPEPEPVVIPPPPPLLPPEPAPTSAPEPVVTPASEPKPEPEPKPRRWDATPPQESPPPSTPVPPTTPPMVEPLPWVPRQEPPPPPPVEFRANGSGTNTPPNRWDRPPAQRPAASPRAGATPPQTWIVLGLVLILISCVLGIVGSAVDLPFFFDAPAWCTFPVGVIILVIGLIQLVTRRPNL